MHMIAQQYGITSLPKCPRVAMAYVPYQIASADKVYSAEQGLYAGTMFPELNKPFKGDMVGEDK